MTAEPSTARRATWIVPMRARRPDERHRTATPLELLFDLCFVVAVAAAASELHHSFVEGHPGPAVLIHLAAFFAIWWAWMGFTWFASAFDTDDGVYRLATLVQIVGVLVLAAGVPALTDSADLTLVTIGYVIMRIALVGQWLRVAHSAPEYRRTALWYAVGSTVVQLVWIGRLFLPDGMLWPAFGVLVVLELTVPLLAERQGATPWHPHHIAERYSLFTIIVLGEAVLGVTNALSGAFEEGAGETVELVALAVAGAVVVFGLWWVYFDEPAADVLTAGQGPWSWAYGHYGIFASVAAVGAGLEVAVDAATGHLETGELVAAAAVPVPVAVFLLVVWLLHVRHRGDRYGRVAVTAFPAAAVAVLCTPFLGAPVQLTALVLVALVTVVQVAKSRGVPAPDAVSAASGPPS